MPSFSIAVVDIGRAGTIDGHGRLLQSTSFALRIESESQTNAHVQNYRAALGRAKAPCIPYIGVALSDLTFVEDGSPDTLYMLLSVVPRSQLLLTGPPAMASSISRRGRSSIG